MTFPAKENLIFFENLDKRQERIYQDACDVGIDLTRLIKDEARENLMALMKVYKYELTRPDHARHPHDTDWMKCSTTTLFIPFEQDEGRYVGVKMTIDFMTIAYLAGKKVDKEFLTIDIRRHAQKDSGYQPVKETWASAANDARKRFDR